MVAPPIYGSGVTRPLTGPVGPSTYAHNLQRQTDFAEVAGMMSLCLASHPSYKCTEVHVVCLVGCMFLCGVAGLSRARIGCHRKAQQGSLHYADRQQIWNRVFVRSIHTLVRLCCVVFYLLFMATACLHVYFTIYADTFGLNLAAALSKALLFSSRSTKRGCCGAAAFKELFGADVSHNAHVIHSSRLSESTTRIGQYVRS